MIPKIYVDPNLNIVVIGAYILQKLKIDKCINLDSLIETVSIELSLSIDHIILSLDWFYIINSIILNDITKEICLNEI